MTGYTPQEQAVITAMENGATRHVIYVEDHESFGRFILSDQVRNPTAEAAHGIAALAATMTHKKTGELASNYHVKKDAGTLKVDRNLRVKVEVFNDDPAAASEEFGNKHVGFPGHRALGRAGAVFGDLHTGKKGV